MVEGNNGWKPELVSNPDPSQTYNLTIQVPQTINTLETLTNKRLQSEQTYTISTLMNDPTNNAGITKNSTLIVDVPEPVYPEINFNTITTNNIQFSLSQLTSNQSEYFSKNSTIKCNITPTPITYGINYFRFSTDGINTKRKLTKVNSNTNVQVYDGQELIRMGVDNNTGRIWLNFILNSGPWTATVSAGDYYTCANFVSGSGSRIDFYDNNDNFLFANGTSSQQNAYTYLPNTLYYIDM